MKKKPIGKIKKNNAMHKATGTPKGKKIPVSKLKKVKAKAEKSGNTKKEKEANFAIVSRKWKHKGGRKRAS